jgi:hypothetical protein
VFGRPQGLYLCPNHFLCQRSPCSPSLSITTLYAIYTGCRPAATTAGCRGASIRSTSSAIRTLDEWSQGPRNRGFAMAVSFAGTCTENAAAGRGILTVMGATWMGRGGVGRVCFGVLCVLCQRPASPSRKPVRHSPSLRRGPGNQLQGRWRRPTRHVEGAPEPRYQR